MKYEKVGIRSNKVMAAALRYHLRLVLLSIKAAIRLATVSAVSGIVVT
jgi:hypothetical protein